ncbi:MAG: ATP-binding protein [Cellulosilyticaceae bacterium]
MEKKKEKVILKHQEVERSIIKKYRKEIWTRFVKAINEYELIKDGDRIAVCISGGKDSMILAKCMQELSKHGKKNFEVKFLVMDPGYNEINRQVIEENAKMLNIPVEIFETQIFDIVASVDESPCYLCAKMRRGYLYKQAQEMGCNKIALGHHFDDVIETTLMSMLYSGEIKTMMPKLHSTNFEGMELIRPLYMVREEDIIAWMRHNELRFIQCACRFTENCMLGDTGGGSKRQEMKALVKKFRKTNPHIEMNIFRSTHNVNLDTVTGYRKNGKEHNFLDEYDK